MRLVSLRRLLLATSLLLGTASARAQAPTGLMPNGQTTALEFDFDWAPVAGASSYRVQLATGRTFHADSLVVLPGGGDTTADSLVLRAYDVRLKNKQTYYWRVRASNQPWSATATFRTVEAGAAPGADYPSKDLEVVTTTPEFSWNLGTGAKGYLAQIQVRAASAPKDWSQTLVDQMGLDMVRYTIPAGVLRDSASYVWRVRAFVPPASGYFGWGTDMVATWPMSNGPVGPWRTVGASLEVPFTTRPVLVAPVANYPSGVDVMPQPPFSWFSDMPGGAGVTHDLEIVLRTAGFTGTPTASGLATRSYTPAAPLAEGTRYRWRVRSCADGGARCTAWSAPLDFTTRAAAPPVTPAVSWPTGGATVYGLPVSLSWNAPGAPTGQRYIVYTRTCTALSCSDAPAISGANTGYVASAPTTATSHVLTAASGTGYAWYVRTADGAGTPGMASGLAKFRTFQPPAAVATPTWPVGNAVVYTNAPTLSWTVENATGGAFEVRWGTSNNPDAATNASATTAGGATSFAVPSALAWGTRIYWHVRPAGTVRWRSANFTIVGAPGSLRAVHTTPTDGAALAGTSATLAWYVDGHVAAVASYEVQVSTRSNFAASKTTTSTVAAPAQSLAVQNLAPGTTHWWRVRAFNGTAWSSWSVVTTFTTAAGTGVILPLAASPTDYAEADDAPTLSWALPVASESALTFDVEVATDEAMTNPERVSAGAGEAAVVLARRAPGTYHWRVRSRTASGEASEFSEVASFIVYGAGSVTAADVPARAAALRLDAPTPNPVRGAATIRFALPAAGDVTIDVIDLAGRRVRTLATGTHAAGAQSVEFDGLTDAGGALSSGVYVLRLRSGDTVRTQPLVVVR